MSNLEKTSLKAIGQDLYMRRLTNGLQVYILPKKDFREVSGLISVDYGSLDNKLTTDGENWTLAPFGLAHFLEHRLFSLADGRDASLEFIKLGAESNAFTGFEKTQYVFSTKDNLVANLTLLLDMVSDCQISQEDLERERVIIAQEIDMYQDDADYLLYAGVLKQLYPRTALAEDIAGTRESIEQLTCQDLIVAHQMFYQPANMTLVLAGQCDVKQVDKLLDSYQEKHITSNHVLPKRERLDIVAVQPKGSLSVVDVSKAKLALGLRGVVTENFSLLEQKIGLRLFFSLLFGWMSETYQGWYEMGKIDDSFDMEIEVGHTFRFVFFLLDTDQPIAMAGLLKKVLKTFHQSSDLTDRHLDLVKREMYGDFMRSLDDVTHLPSQFVTYLAQGQTYLDIPSLLEQLTLADVMAIGQDFLAQAQFTEFTVFPK